MSTPTLHAALAATLLGTVWLLPMGVIRMLAYKSAEVDHTPGMRKIAIMALTLGVVFAAATVTLAVVVSLR